MPAGTDGRDSISGEVHGQVSEGPGTFREPQIPCYIGERGLGEEALKSGAKKRG